jgi:hypothetical protein
VQTSHPKKVTESGIPVADAEGVKRIRTEAGAAVFEVGSGHYMFESPLK